MRPGQDHFQEGLAMQVTMGAVVMKVSFRHSNITADTTLNTDSPTPALKYPRQDQAGGTKRRCNWGDDDKGDGER
jgi:hypothetical protein